MTKITNVSMTDELWDEMERVRKNYGMNRSGFVSLCIRNFINNEKVINILPEFTSMMGQINDIAIKLNDMEDIKK